MKVLTIQVPDDMHADLFLAAANRGESASLYVRDAIREKLARETHGEVVSFPAAPSVNRPLPRTGESRPLTPEEEAAKASLWANARKANAERRA